jgi:hypothetical protein
MHTASSNSVTKISKTFCVGSGELSFKLKLVPEQQLAQQFFANRSDHVLNERVARRRNMFSAVRTRRECNEIRTKRIAPARSTAPILSRVIVRP